MNKGNNKESINFSNKAKKEIITNALRNSLMSNNNTFLNKGNNKTLFNSNIRNTTKDANTSQFIMANSEINTNRLNKTKNFEVMNNLSAINKNNFDNFNNMKTGIDNTIVVIDNEKELIQRNMEHQINDSITTESFATDTDFNNSNTNFAATGSVGVMGSKYQVRHKEYETSIFANSANDSISFNKSKYIK